MEVGTLIGFSGDHRLPIAVSSESDSYDKGIGLPARSVQLLNVLDTIVKRVPMLNLPVLRYMELAEGRALPNLYSEFTGLSERTFRTPGSLSTNSAKKAEAYARDFVRQQLDKNGWTAAEIDAWLAQHPGKGLYSDLIYGHQIDGLKAFPHTLELACVIDTLSSCLIEAWKSDDLSGFKKALLHSQFSAAAYLFLSREEAAQASSPVMLERLSTAKAWTEIDEPLRTLTVNVLYSLLARLDVEFCAQYFSKFEPRSCFAMVLPRLDPNAGNASEGKISKRRGMFVYPVRRLIDLMACMGEFARDHRWPRLIPELKQIVRDTKEVDRNLVNWRDGTKRFTRRDFMRLWQALCPPRNDSRGPIHAPVPWPLFVATVLWQYYLVSVSATSKEKSIMLVEDDYLPWWRRHHEDLKTKGCTFGTSPWPICFNEV